MDIPEQSMVDMFGDKEYMKQTIKAIEKENGVRTSTNIQ